MQMSFDLTIYRLISIAEACLSQFSIGNLQSESPARSAVERACACAACLQAEMPLLLSKYIVERQRESESEREECEPARAISNVFTLPANQQSEQ